jgi:hypothetical protein
MEDQFSLSESFKNKYGGDYSDIEDELKNVYINFGKDLGWDCTNPYSSNRIEFKSGTTWRSWGETITVKYSKTNISIKSVAIGSPWGPKNEENCERFMSVIVPWVEEYLISKESERLNKEKKEELILNSKVETIVSELDTDRNGEVDLVDGESFNKLLNKHQKTISEIDKTYIQKFVKISIYLKTKRKNTQNMFDSIHDTRNIRELDELVKLLKNQIHTYELMVFHSLSMITSLVENDLITFYEIYESFDQVGVFNSNWENEVSNKLSDIGDGIRDLMYSINTMENNIINSLDNLTYSTHESFGELNKSISSQLSSIDSSININNLLTGIQTYQMYKVNQNTKRIN